MTGDLQRLRCLVAVAQAGSFTQAASRLGVSQPAVSKSVRALETSLGVRLFARHPDGVVPTPAGAALISEAAGHLEAVEACLRRARRRGRAPQITIAAKSGAHDALLRRLTRAYAASTGNDHVDVIHSTGHRRDLVLTGAADFALLHTPANRIDGLDVLELHREAAWAVAGRTHPVSFRETITLEDLDSQTLVSWPETAQPAPHHLPATDLTDLILTVAAGTAIAVLPSSALDFIPRSLITVPITPAHTMTVVLAWQADSKDDRVRAFVRAVQQELDAA